MRWNGSTRSALFAAAAGAGVIIWLLAAGPVLGGRRALAVALALLPAIYLGGLAPRGAARLRVTAAAAVLGGVVGLAGATLAERALALGVLLGALRSGVVYRLQPGRAALAEVVLVGGGLLFARFLAGPSAFAIGLAVWGFFLVQSAFFLIGGTRERSRAERDPFDDALRQAAAILDGDGV
jgi:hypothetical protein